MDEYNIIKIALIGEANIGKSSLIKAMSGEFKRDSIGKYNILEMYYPTFGVDIKFVYDVDKKLKLTFYDLGGLQQYRSIVETFVTTCDIVLFCFSFNNTISLIEMRNQYKHYKNIGSLTDKKIFVIATQNDMKNDCDNIEKCGQQFAEKIGAEFVITSSKHNHNISLLLELLSTNIYTMDMIDLVDERSPLSSRSNRVSWCNCNIL